MRQERKQNIEAMDNAKSITGGYSEPEEMHHRGYRILFSGLSKLFTKF